MGFRLVRVLVSALLIGAPYASPQSKPPVANIADLENRANSGDADAQFYLGTLYVNGQGVLPDDVQAAVWYRKAAEQGYEPAELAIANAYRYGLGVSMDSSLAAEWYRKAADHGSTEAQFAMGDLYGFGEGVSQDFAQAAAWYRKAAELGVADAQSDLGELYLYGIGVDQDYEQAYFWYTIAIARKLSPYLARDAAKNMSAAALHLTPAGLLTTQQRAQKWRADHQDHLSKHQDFH
jgi:TPR repeat protein